MAGKTSLIQLFGPAKAPGTAAPQGDTGGASSGARAHAISGGGVGGQAAAGEPVVAIMQKLMGDLAAQIFSNPSAVKESTRTELSPQAIKNQAQHFGTTGAGASRAEKQDGVWGTNTRNALLAIKGFVSSLKIQGVNINPGTGEQPFKSMQHEDLVNVASDNIDALNGLFSAIGLQSSVSTTDSVGSLVVDSIDPSLSDYDNLFEAPGWGNTPVIAANLADFPSFFSFIQRLRTNFACEPLAGAKPQAKAPAVSTKAVAEEILDRTIFRLGQEATSATHTAPVERQGLCPNMVSKIVDWFVYRAQDMWDAMARAYQSVPRGKNPRPDKNGQRVTEQDARLAKFYLQQMNEIAKVWHSIKDDIEDALRQAGKENEPYISLRDVKQALRSSSASSASGARAHAAGGEDRGKEETGYTYRGRQKRQQEPPIGEFISLDRFNNSYIDDLKEMSESSRPPDLHLEQWMHGDWKQIAMLNGIDEGKFGVWADAVRKALLQLYNDWAGPSRSKSIEADQYAQLGEWIGAIKNTVARWNRNYANPLQQARGR